MLTDAIIILAFFAFAILGYARGLVKSAASLVRVSVSVVIAFIISRPIAAILNSIFGLNKALSNAFGVSSGKAVLIAIITIIIFIAIRLVLHKLVKFAEKSREKSRVFNHIDRWLGALFGALRFLFLFSLFAIGFYLLTRISFIRPLENTVFSDSHIANWLYKFVVKIILVQGIAAIAPK